MTILAEPQTQGEIESEHLRRVFDQGGIGAWELDIGTGEAWRNLRHDQIFGYEMLLPSWSYEQFLSHVIEEDRETVDALYGAALARDETWSFETRIDRVDGERRWISATGWPIKNDGETVRLIGHVIDITHVKRTEEHLRMVMHELNHRVRNTLTIVQAIASQSFPAHISVEEGRNDFGRRIQALAAAHSLLVQANWTGAKIGDIVHAALDPYCGGARYDARGGEEWLPPKAAVSLAMTLNELATNAVKYGALSVSGGRVDIEWSCEEEGDGRRCRLVWTEGGGPPVREPQRRGFGMTLIQRLMPSEMHGTADMRFEATGLVCRLTFQAGGSGAR